MKLLGNKAIVEMPPNKTGGGIIIPDSVKDAKKNAWKRGKVIALGSGVKPECAVKVGDVVLFQYGFDTVDAEALAAISKDDKDAVFMAEGELWIGNPESLFAVVEGKKRK